jgi:hypothetical protein
MKKIFVVFIIFLLLCPYVTADGMMFVRKPPQDSDMWTGEVRTADRNSIPSTGYEWNLQPENQQIAAIHYEEGMENLLLSITTDDSLAGEQAVWIYPIPSSPDRVSIDVISGYPELHGRDVEVDASRTAVTISGWLTAYATAPVGLMYGFPVLFLLSGMGMASEPGTKGASLGIGHSDSLSNNDPDAITVYSRVDRMGVASELITAKNADALHQYLKTKGMEDPETSAASLDGYIGKDYSFVITTISNISQFKTESAATKTHIIGSFVKFPTDQIYFPLIPTRVYGSRQIPVLLYVTGHVTPNLYASIRANATTNYYTQAVYSPPGDLEPFFNNNQHASQLDYTKIKITTPSDTFTEDLWIDNNPPLIFSIKKGVHTNPWLAGILLFVILSLVAGLAAGTLWFRKRPVPKKTLLVLGLGNCLTMAGFVAATRLALENRVDERKSYFVLLYYLIFAGLLSVVTLIFNPGSFKTITSIWVFALSGPAGYLVMLSPLHNADITTAGVISIFVLIHMLFMGMILWTLRNWLDPGRQDLLPFIPWLETKPWFNPGRLAFLKKSMTVMAGGFVLLVIFTILTTILMPYDSPLHPVADWWRGIISLFFSHLGLFGGVIVLCLYLWSWFFILNGTLILLLKLMTRVFQWLHLAERVPEA